MTTLWTSDNISAYYLSLLSFVTLGEQLAVNFPRHIQLVGKAKASQASYSNQNE